MKEQGVWERDAFEPQRPRVVLGDAHSWPQGLGAVGPGRGAGAGTLSRVCGRHGVSAGPVVFPCTSRRSAGPTVVSSLWDAFGDLKKYFFLKWGAELFAPHQRERTLFIFGSQALTNRVKQRQNQSSWTGRGPLEQLVLEEKGKGRGAWEMPGWVSSCLLLPINKILLMILQLYRPVRMTVKYKT